MSIKIEDSWYNLLQEEFEKPYFNNIKSHLLNQKAAGKKIYPKGSLIFNAFDTTPVSNVKVVILGQDPYHNPGQAMGLSFSVPKGMATPPSLKNIYKELHSDLGITIPNHGDLSSWAQQGVLLLNAILTVEHKEAGSHRKIGWEQFTDGIISKLSQNKKNLVFMLWGNFAKQKASLIDGSRHLVLQAAHPSPLARGAYFGSKHFSQCNAYLHKHSHVPIDWKLTTEPSS